MVPSTEGNTLDCMEQSSIPDSEQLGWALRGRDGQFNLVVGHGDLGIELALMEHSSVHLKPGIHKFGDVDSHLCHKLQTHRGHEEQLLL